VTERSASSNQVGAADLEYDLAHDAGTAAVPGQRHTDHPERPSTLVSTETSDSASDYSYDLAHDIPKA
jgi:hypothetical protein